MWTTRPQQVVSSVSFSLPTVVCKGKGHPAFAGRCQQPCIEEASGRKQLKAGGRAGTAGGQGRQQSKGGGLGLEPNQLVRILVLSLTSSVTSVSPSVKWAYWQCLPQRGVVGTVPGAGDSFLQESTVHPLSLWTGKGSSGPSRHLAPVVSLRTSRGFLTSPEV